MASSCPEVPPSVKTTADLGRGGEGASVQPPCGRILRVGDIRRNEPVAAVCVGGQGAAASRNMHDRRAERVWAAFLLLPCCFGQPSYPPPFSFCSSARLANSRF